MLRRTAFLAVIFALASEMPVYAASKDSAWLPLKQSDVLDLYTIATSGESLTVETLDVQTAKVGDVLAFDDTISVARNRTIAIVMAGKGDEVHSLRVTVPVVNYSKDEADQVFAFLSNLFKATYPNWMDAEQWPTNSLKETWNKSPLMTNITPANPDDLIARSTIDGITSATFGVPPDIVVYTITTRDQCVPSVSRGNPFQRLIC